MVPRPAEDAVPRLARADRGLADHRVVDQPARDRADQAADDTSTQTLQLPERTGVATTAGTQALSQCSRADLLGRPCGVDVGPGVRGRGQVGGRRQSRRPVSVACGGGAGGRAARPAPAWVTAAESRRPPPCLGGRHPRGRGMLRMVSWSSAGPEAERDGVRPVPGTQLAGTGDGRAFSRCPRPGTTRGRWRRSTGPGTCPAGSAPPVGSAGHPGPGVRRRPPRPRRQG